MKDYTDFSREDVDRAVPAVVLLLRRAGATAGFVFGLGLLALVMAGNAGADEAPRGGNGSQPRAVSSVLSSVLSPLTEPAGQALRPVTPVVAGVAGAVEPVVRPVAEVAAGVTEAVEPVLRPVAEIAAPVVAPVLGTVAPVLDVVAPVIAPVTGPLLDAVAPVVEPVAAAVGVRDEVIEVTETVGGARVEVPAPLPGAVPVPVAAVPVVSTLEPVVPAVAGRGVRGDAAPITSAAATASSASVMPSALDGSGEPGRVPAVPAAPSGAVPGSGSLGGFGGSHSADAAVTSPYGSSADDGRAGRGPPGTIAGLSWFGYDRPACPS